MKRALVGGAGDVQMCSVRAALSVFQGLYLNKALVVTRFSLGGCALLVECGTEGDGGRWEVACELLTHWVNDDDDV